GAPPRHALDRLRDLHPGGLGPGRESGERGARRPVRAHARAQQVRAAGRAGGLRTLLRDRLARGPSRPGGAPAQRAADASGPGSSSQQIVGKPGEAGAGLVQASLAKAPERVAEHPDHLGAAVPALDDEPVAIVAMQRPEGAAARYVLEAGIPAVPQQAVARELV